ncbi:MAG: TetR/AcrR family transcriptional regulator [Chloroflexi bacterium]|nr:TetR/AcrR family transcriptional regulator [Chloroflexota bacterium]
MAIVNTLGRPLEFDPDKAIDAAIEVFWCKGYEATSMTDLLEAMNLSKSSLYQTFGSKRQLFKRCLSRYVDNLSAEMTQELENASSGRSFIEDTFVSIANTAQQPEGAKGCLVGNSANEFGQREPALTAPVTDGLNRFARVFTDAVVKAQAEGSISADADPLALGNYLVGTMNGLRMMIKAGADKRSAKGMVTLILKALN